MTVTIGLIGYGRFGEFAAAHLVRRAKVVVHDAKRSRLRNLPVGVRRGSLIEVASQPVVVLAVPVSSLRSLLTKLRRHVRPGSLVVDVCAVKSTPIRWMKESLPADVGILGTHPFFGPDSAHQGLRGKTMVLCPVRISSQHLARILTEFHRLGIETVFMAPREHDRFMAETILLTQYIGRLVARSGAHRWPWVTANYAHLLSIADTVRHDTTELFVDMVHFNPNGMALIASLHKAMKSLGRDLRRSRR
jgi:prephenate dehydrogenase